jgi:phenylalanyl-tRNA synthetase beta chain
MKISRDWLSDFVEWFETDPQVIADQLTRRVGEVEEVIEPGALLEHCVVGKVLSSEKHPNADKLSLCLVQTEQGNKTVVCGGTNVRTGMLVAFAHVGATVKWHGDEQMTLTRVKIRGVESEGMICAQEELALTEFPPKPEDGPRPIIDLSKLKTPNSKLSVGSPLRQALGLSDVVFHIDNHAITNRPDLFSHIGVARELVAMGLASWKKLPKKKKPLFPKTELSFKRVNQIPHLIPRYCACTLSMDDIGETPEWMQRRLRVLGWRPINLPVDITNYVSLELGMPLHSFDIADLKGAVQIRTAKQGEKITTLDEVERVLPEGAVVLSDEEGIFDLLGIMGGLRSSTKNSSRLLYLHAAVVDPVAIRRSVIATGLRTDAATVYEKGIPLATTEEGFFRALELFLSLAPGARITSKMESAGENDRKKRVTVPMETFRSVMGVDIKGSEAKRILTDLGCVVSTQGKTSLAVTPPPWRNDMVLKQDIIEEVARIYGYAKVPVTMPEASVTPPLRDPRIHQVRDALKESGYFELLHVAFTSPQLLAKMGIGKDPVSVENPIGEEVSLLRPGLLPGLLVTAARELKKLDAKHLKVFETGHAFSRGKEWDECTMLVAAHGNTTLSDDPFLLLKADVIRALLPAGHRVLVRPSTTVHTMGHPGKSAELICGEKRIGLLFEIHPRIRDAAELPFRAAACIIDTDILRSLAPETRVFVPLPAFPAISFDETIPLKQGTDHGRLLSSLSKLDPLLRSVENVDLFARDTTRTVTLRFTYRADDRTLTQEEVEKIHARVLTHLKKG